MAKYCDQILKKCKVETIKEEIEKAKVIFKYIPALEKKEYVLARLSQ